MEGEKEISFLTLQLKEREEKISQLMENMKGYFKKSYFS